MKLRFTIESFNIFLQEKFLTEKGFRLLIIIETIVYAVLLFWVIRGIRFREADADFLRLVEYRLVISNYTIFVFPILIASNIILIIKGRLSWIWFVKVSLWCSLLYFISPIVFIPWIGILWILWFYGEDKIYSTFVTTPKKENLLIKIFVISILAAITLDLFFPIFVI